MAWGKAIRERADVKIDRVKNKVQHREDVVTLDFETYYDKDYTLSKLSYSEYIRDPRFEVICCGVKVGTGPTIVLEGKALERRFKQIDWSKTDLLAHNNPFDGFIMSHHFKVIPHRYLCTLAMARGLFGNDIRGDLDTVSKFLGGGGKIKGVLQDAQGLHIKDIKARGNGRYWEDFKDYCANDVDECYDAFHKMMVMLPPLEITKIDIFIRAFCDPVLGVDRERVKKELEREIENKERVLLQAVGSKAEQAKLILLLGKQKALEFAKKEIGSGPKFAAMLVALGVTPPVKQSPTNPLKAIHAFSKTDEDFLALQEHPNPQVRELVEARLSVKSTTNETRAARFIKASENGNKLPVLLNYYAAHTGRPGGGNKMNMLNLVRGGELRRSILAPKGYKVVVADSSQLEARVAMWIAGQFDALEEFRLYDQKKGRDPYSIFADEVYGFTIDPDKHPKERHVGKVAKLQLQYQAGPPRFQTTMALGALGGEPMFLELSEAQRIVYTYRKRHNMIVKAWDICTGIIEDMVRGRTGEWGPLKWEKERIHLPNGMCLKYPGIREHKHEQGRDWTYMRKGQPSKVYGGLLFENIVQALANVIITEHMVKIAEKYRIVTMTYDENVWIAPTKEAQKSYDFGVKIMCVSPDWCPELPLNAKGGFDNNYSK